MHPGFAISSKWSAHTAAFAFQNLTPIATDPVLGKNVFIGLRRNSFILLLSWSVKFDLEIQLKCPR